MRDVHKYPSPFRELAGRYELIAKMQADPELGEPERQNMDLRSKTSEEKAKECRYYGAVIELDRALRPEEVNIAYIHLRELGDYKDANAIVERHRAEKREKERQRKKAEEDYLRLRALSRSGEEKSFSPDGLDVNQIVTIALVIIVLLMLLIAFVTQ